MPTSAVQAVRWMMFAAAILTLAAPGCDSQVKVSDLNVQDLDYASVNELQTNPKMIKKMGPVVLLDIRPEQAYQQGHIPGAVNIPLSHIVGLDDRLANARTIVIYGGGWDDPLAPVAWKKMRSLGYEGLYTFRGGVKEWVGQGRSLDQAAAERTAGASGE